MAARKWTAAESSVLREKFVDAAYLLVKDEGLGSLTAGRVATQLGLSRQIVHYYFSSMDDLLVQVMRRAFDEERQALAAALERDDPVHVLWSHYSVVSSSYGEVLTRAMRSDMIAAEYRRSVQILNDMISSHIEERLGLRLANQGIPASSVSLIVRSMSQAMAVERALGITEGHVGVARMIDQLFGAADAPLTAGE